MFLNSFPAASLTNLDAQFLTGKSNSLSNTTANSEFLKPRILVAVKSYPTSCAVELPFYKTAVRLACTKSCFGPALFGSSETTHERKGLARTVICGGTSDDDDIGGIKKKVHDKAFANQR